MKSNKKILILLDLDNTAICAEDLDSIKDPSKIDKARKKFHNMRMIDYYDIFERPHLQEFLDFLFQNNNIFDVGVWTAASKDYAIFVVQNFITKDKSERKIKLFLCSHHCNISKRNFKGVTKDLKLISDKWNLKYWDDIVLVDDLEDLAKHQPSVISIKPFFYDKEEAYSDTELLKVKDILKKKYFKG